MFKKCVECCKVGKRCIPYLVSLSSEELLIWCRMRKKKIRMTNEELAEKSGVPKGTIDRLFAAGNKEFRYSTMQNIVFTLLEVHGDELTCEENPEPDEVILNELEERHQAEIKNMAVDYRQRIDFVKQQLEFERVTANKRLKIIGVLAVATAIFVIFVFAALVIDVTNHNLGFFWK